MDMHHTSRKTIIRFNVMLHHDGDYARILAECTKCSGITLLMESRRGR